MSWSTRTRFRPAAAVLCLALGVVATGACATGRGGGEGPFDESGGAHVLTVEVRNDRGPTSTLRIFIVPDNGSAELLGTLVGGGPKSFTVRIERTRSQYRLAARSADGERFVSRPFVPGGAGGVSWEVESNHLIRR